MKGQGTGIRDDEPVVYGMLIYSHRHPFRMQKHGGIDHGAGKSAEQGEAANDAPAHLAGFEQVAAQWQPPQPEKMREEMESQRVWHSHAGMSRIKFMPNASLECLLDGKQDRYQCPQPVSEGHSPGLPDGVQATGCQNGSSAIADSC